MVTPPATEKIVVGGSRRKWSWRTWLGCAGVAAAV